jgi:hypothetical protein
MSRFLGGADVGFKMPAGTFVGPNLTADKETGLGAWSDQEVVTALRTGVRPDGRILADVMPWKAFAGLSKADADAMVAYLRSLPVVRNKVAGPFGPGEPPTISVLAIIPPDAGR